MYRMARWYPIDCISNIGFIASKILVLQKCLRIVRTGLDKCPGAPSDRLLSVVVVLLCVSVSVCFALSFLAFTDVQEQSNLVDEYRKNSQSNKTIPTLKGITSYWSSATVMFVLATLSSLLYIRHTTFHLYRYLNTLTLKEDTTERRLSDDDEQNDTAELSAFGRIKRFAMNLPIQKTVKTLSGNLRRLQLSVALIALSLLLKAVLYSVLAAGYNSDPDVLPSSNSDEPSYVDRHLCVFEYSTDQRIRGRTIFGSPLVFPLFTLCCDPLLTMYAPLPSPPIIYRTDEIKSPTSLKQKTQTNVYFYIICSYSKSQPHLRVSAVRG